MAGAASALIVPGFYYYNGSLWIRIGPEQTAGKVAATTDNSGPNVVTLGNLKVRFSTTDGKRSVEVATTGGAYDICGSHQFVMNGTSGGRIISCASGSTLNINTTFKRLIDTDNFGNAGDLSMWTIFDQTQNMAWRITAVVGFNYSTNLISVERLTQN